MPPERPEKAPSSSQRRRRSRSLNVTAAEEAIGLNSSPDLETSSSRKHGRDDNDTRIENPSKRRKQRHGSVPPMCKDTSKTPKAKRRKLREDVNHRKASRTSNYQKLRESHQTLQQDLEGAKQKHHDKEQELKEKIETLETQVADFKRKYQMTEQKLETSKANVQRLECELANSIQAHDDTTQELYRTKQQLEEEIESLKSQAVNSKREHQVTEQELETLEDHAQHLQRELASSNQAHNDTKQQLEQRQKDLTRNTTELKRARMICDENSEKLREQQVTIETNSRDLQSLTESCQNRDGELKAKDANMVTLQVKLDELQEKLTKVSHELEAARTVNDSNGYWNERLVQKEHRAKESLKKERQDNKKSIVALGSEKEQLQQYCTDLKQSHKTQKEMFNRTITSLQQDVQDARAQSQRFNFELPDEVVMQDFNKLESKIRQFADAYALPVFGAADEDLKIMWPDWSPELPKFLSYPLMCNLIFEGYIWERLLARIFTPWSKVWDGKLGPALETTLSIAKDEAANSGLGSDLDVDYQHWRSNSSTFIGRLNAVKILHNSFGSDVEDVVRGLAGLCGYEASDDMRARVLNIFTDARDFEIQLRKLKAEYTFCMCKSVLIGETHKHGFYFDDQDMADRSRSAAARIDGQFPLVDFIMSPGLHKRGSNDGEGYENAIWLVKMGVVCNAAKLMEKTETTASAPPAPIQAHRVLPSIEVKQENEGYGTPSQCHSGFKASGIKTETPATGLTPLENVESTDARHKHHLMSAPRLASTTQAPKLQDAPQMQSIPTSNMVTRSQASLNAGIKSESSHSHFTGNSTGPGGEGSAKKMKSSRIPGSDAKIDSEDMIHID